MIQSSSYISIQWRRFSILILICTQLFDSMDTHKGVMQGKSIVVQWRNNRALESMRLLVETMRFANNTAKTEKLPFQKGILLSINSLLGLFEDLQKKGVDYLLTKNINQDCLENFFSLLRSFGTSHSGPVDVMHKIKLILVGANPKNALSVINPSVEMETP